MRRRAFIAGTAVTAALSLARPASAETDASRQKRISDCLSQRTAEVLPRRGLKQLGSDVRAGAALDALTREDALFNDGRDMAQEAHQDRNFQFRRSWRRGRD